MVRRWYWHVKIAPEVARPVAVTSQYRPNCLDVGIDRSRQVLDNRVDVTLHKDNLTSSI